MKNKEKFKVSQQFLKEADKIYHSALQSNYCVSNILKGNETMKSNLYKLKVEKLVENDKNIKQLIKRYNQTQQQQNLTKEQILRKGIYTNPKIANIKQKLDLSLNLDQIYQKKKFRNKQTDHKYYLVKLDQFEDKNPHKKFQYFINQKNIIFKQTQSRPQTIESKQTRTQKNTNISKQTDYENVTVKKNTFNKKSSQGSVNDKKDQQQQNQYFQNEQSGSHNSSESEDSQSENDSPQIPSCFKKYEQYLQHSQPDLSWQDSKPSQIRQITQKSYKDLIRQKNQDRFLEHYPTISTNFALIIEHNRRMNERMNSKKLKLPSIKNLDIQNKKFAQNTQKDQLIREKLSMYSPMKLSHVKLYNTLAYLSKKPT